MDILESKFIVENLTIIFSIFLILFIPRYSKVFWNLSTEKYTFSNTYRIKSIDSIKGIAIIAVIIIHGCYFALSQNNNFINNSLFILINNIARFAIPVFLFSSGLLLRRFILRPKNIFIFYISKIIRIGIPYIAVNIILWQIGYNNSASIWSLILTGDMALPFYFIPVLFQLYILYPLLDYIRNISPKYLLLVSLIVSLFSLLNPSTWQFFGIPTFAQYLVFFVYGMVQQNVLSQKSIKIWAELILIYFILQIITIFSIMYVEFNKNTLKLIYFYNFQIILGFGFVNIFLQYLQSSLFGHKFIQKIFAPIGVCSLWIFLLHFPIQQSLFVLNYIPNLSPILNLIRNIVLTIIITFPLAFILNRIYSNSKFLKL